MEQQTRSDDQDHDNKLIEKASDLHWKDWVLIDDMMKQARLVGTYDKLKRIRQDLYHQEEWAARMH